MDLLRLRAFRAILILHDSPHRKLLIMADGGGSNASRSRLWKSAIQRLADRLDFPVHVCHFPPGTSKWNKIEHKMVSYITQNWCGRPLISHEVIINLIGHTVTKTGLNIKAELDKGKYGTSQKITDDEIMRIKLLTRQYIFRYLRHKLWLDQENIA